MNIAYNLSYKLDNECILSINDVFSSVWGKLIWYNVNDIPNTFYHTINVTFWCFCVLNNVFIYCIFLIMKDLF